MTEEFCNCETFLSQAICNKKNYAVHYYNQGRVTEVSLFGAPQFKRATFLIKIYIIHYYIISHMVAMLYLHHYHTILHHTSLQVTTVMMNPVGIVLRTLLT